MQPWQPKGRLAIWYPRAKKALIVRGGKGIGDLLYTTPVARLLKKEGFVVDVCVWPQNEPVYRYNPNINQLHYYPDTTPEKWTEWLNNLATQYDLPVSLGFTVEKRFMHKTDGTFGDIPDLATRQATARDKNYFDETLRAAGFALSEGEHAIPELYLSQEEVEYLQAFEEQKKQDGAKVLLWNMMGSTKNKQLVRGFVYLRKIMEEFPESIHFIVDGKAYDSAAIPQSPRVKHVGFHKDADGTVHGWQLRTALIMTAVADCVIGPESAMVNAAGCWDTPKVVFYSHSAPANLGQYWQNHYPVVPACECHPCYLIPMEWRNTWIPELRQRGQNFEVGCREPHPQDIYRSIGYKCVTSITDEAALDAIRRALVNGRQHQ